MRENAVQPSYASQGGCGTSSLDESHSVLNRQEVEPCIHERASQHKREARGPAPADYTYKPQREPRVAERATRKILRHALHGIGVVSTPWLQHSTRPTVLSLFFSPRFHVPFFKVLRPMVVDTERGARGKKIKSKIRVGTVHRTCFAHAVCGIEHYLDALKACCSDSMYAEDQHFQQKCQGS